MPDLHRFETMGMNRIRDAAAHLFDLAAYECLYRFSPARKHKFFNGGYLPLAADLLPLSADQGAGEEHAAMMYHFVAAAHPGALADPPSRILDLGCGQGGGLSYIARLFPKAAVIGTDRNRTVVRLAQRNLAQVPNVSVRPATGDRLDFPQGHFDLTLSVGAPTYLGLSRFVSEAARVTAPGGTISFTAGYRQGDHAAIEAEIRDAAAANGLDFVRYTNITPNTFASLKADIPRREAALARVPWPFRLYGEKWADMPGSTEYEEYETGKRADFGAVLHKPAA